MKNKLQAFRFAPETAELLKETSERTGRSQTEIAEFAINKLASTWRELAAESCWAIAQVVLADLGRVSPETKQEINLWKKQSPKPQSDDSAPSSMANDAMRDLRIEKRRPRRPRQRGNQTGSQ